MCRLCIVPWLVLAVLLSGCKSAQQAPAPAAAPEAPPAEQVGRYVVGEDGWFDRHPIVKGSLIVAGTAVGVVLLVGFVVLGLYMSGLDDSD